MCISATGHVRNVTQINLFVDPIPRAFLPPPAAGRFFSPALYARTPPPSPARFFLAARFSVSPPSSCAPQDFLGVSRAILRSSFHRADSLALRHRPLYTLASCFSRCRDVFSPVFRSRSLSSLLPRAVPPVNRSTVRTAARSGEIAWKTNEKRSRERSLMLLTSCTREVTLGRCFPRRGVSCAT